MVKKSGKNHIEGWKTNWEGYGNMAHVSTSIYGRGVIGGKSYLHYKIFVISGLCALQGPKLTCLL